MAGAAPRRRLRPLVSFSASPLIRSVQPCGLDGCLELPSLTDRGGRGLGLSGSDGLLAARCIPNGAPAQHRLASWACHRRASSGGRRLPAA
jgi:hypothetical protein